MNIQDCLEKGLLRKDVPDKDKAKKSIEIAENKLERAKKLLGAHMLEETLVILYSSIFHAARSLLFNKGFIEKSHYALYIFIKENYGGKIEKRFIAELNILRLERHEINYGLEKQEIEKESLKERIKIAEEFIDVVKRLR